MNGLNKATLIGIFGNKAGSTLFNWLDDCCEGLCPEVNACLGISPDSQANLVLNKQGTWIVNGSGGFSCQALAACDTDNLPEGSTNLYFTPSKVLTTLGISDGGSSSLFLNQQGDFVSAGGGTPSGTPTQITYFDANTGLLTSDSNFTRDSSNGYGTTILSEDIGTQGQFAIATNTASIGLRNTGAGTANGISISDNILQLIVSNISWNWPTSDSSGVLTSNGSGLLSFQSIPNPSLTQYQVAFGSPSNEISSDVFFTYDGNNVVLNLIDSYGGLHILGRNGGEASFALQPDNVANGAPGQWIFYTNGSQIPTPASFAMYNSTTGSPALILTDSNNVLLNPVSGFTGIGSSNPGYPLDIFMGGATTAYGFATVKISNTDSETGILFNNTSSGGGVFNVFSTGATSSLGTGKFVIGDATTALPRIVIDSVGNVGIGTTTPAANLDVEGDNTFAQPALIVNGGNVAIATANYGWPLAVGGQIVAVDGGGFIIENGGRQLQLSNDGTGNDAITSNGSNLFQINGGTLLELNCGIIGVNSANSGLFGIGTDTPSTTLEVDGTLKFVTGNQGVGKVLTSDGDGNTDWVLQDFIVNSTQSGDGLTQVINVPHGLSSAPQFASVTSKSVDAITTNFYVEWDATNIIITYPAVAPNLGTDNLIYSILIKP